MQWERLGSDTRNVIINVSNYSSRRKVVIVFVKVIKRGKRSVRQDDARLSSFDMHFTPNSYIIRFIGHPVRSHPSG